MYKKESAFIHILSMYELNHKKCKEQKMIMFEQMCIAMKTKTRFHLIEKSCFDVQINNCYHLIRKTRCVND